MTPAPKTVAEQIAAIDQQINSLEQQNLNLENRYDLLDNLPRSAAQELAGIRGDIAGNTEEIKRLRDQKAALETGGVTGGG